MRSYKGRIAFVILTVFLLAGVAIVAGRMAVQPSYAADAVDKTAVLTLQNAFVSVAEQLKPSVVYITAESTKTVPIEPDIDEFFKGFPGFPGFPNPPGGQTRKQIAAGSGVIVREDGYILTNDHVVAGADRVTVKLNDGRKFQGKVMRDPRTDLAVIKIDAKGLPAAKLGDSDKVKVGQWAIAIGSPFGLTNTVTVGVISALTREAVVPDPETDGGARYYPDLIQTDASINAGNSGGPLVNINGEVIGINSIIESPSGANAGIGFAVPSNTAKFVLDQLIAHGRVVRGYLGVEPKDISPEAAKTLGIDKGALVNSVDEGTPAAKAKIKPMDVIVEVAGKPVENSLDLRKIVAAIKPGTTVKVVIFRDKKRQTLDVTIGEAPDVGKAVTPGGKTKLGISVDELTDNIAKQLGVPEGTKGVVVKSVEADSAAGRANPPIMAGDVILEINGQPTSSVAQFDKVVSGLKSGDTALVLLQRKNRTTISEMTLD